MEPNQIHTVCLRYSQVISALQAIHGLEQGVRIYEGGEFSIRRYSMSVPFRLMLASIKAKLHDLHQVLDAYHQGLAPTFVNPETREPFSETQEHYMFLWHAVLSKFAPPILVPVCADGQVPDMPFAMRAHLLPFLPENPLFGEIHSVEVTASNLEVTIDAIQSLEAKVVDGENIAGAVFAEYDGATHWALSFVSAKLHEALNDVLARRNEIRGKYRAADFMLPVDKVSEVAAADAEVLGSKVLLAGLPALAIPQAAFELIQPSAETMQLLEPFLATSQTRV